jgi:hypothetical protein
MFVTSRDFSPLRELISLADAERNNPEVILIGCRKHPEMIRCNRPHPARCGSIKPSGVVIGTWKARDQGISDSPSRPPALPVEIRPHVGACRMAADQPRLASSLR